MSKKGEQRSWFRSVFLPALAIVILAAAIGVGLVRYGYTLPVVGWLFQVPQQTTTSPVVIEGIKELDQLATVRATESVVVTKQSGGSGLRQFLTGEKLVLIATGNVEAGVDLSGLSKNDVKVNGKSVTIRLPESKVLSTSLDENRTRVYDRQQGLLNIRPSDAMAEQARRDAEREILAAAEKNGIRDQARKNAESSIGALVTTIGLDKVRFVR
ncbi:MAG: DUF4230 domain-containing protein [Rubrobacteraceae bacterium]